MTTDFMYSHYLCFYFKRSNVVTFKKIFYWIWYVYLISNHIDVSQRFIKSDVKKNWQLTLTWERITMWNHSQRRGRSDSACAAGLHYYAFAGFVFNSKYLVRLLKFCHGLGVLPRSLAHLQTTRCAPIPYTWEFKSLGLGIPNNSMYKCMPTCACNGSPSVYSTLGRNKSLKTKKIFLSSYLKEKIISA